VACLGGSLLLWARVEYLRFRNVHRRATPTSATIEELAVYVEVAVDDLRSWQNERCLVARHDEHGNLLGADVRR
jgi:poly-beta-1,6-N-acetyl-D-glucosamine biosynthesis protein PgaD